MQEELKRKRIKDTVFTVSIVILCGAMILLDFVSPRYSSDIRRNRWIGDIVQQCCGIVAVLMLMARMKIKLYRKPQGWLFFIPSLIVALDNFPLCSYLAGNMSFERTGALDVVLFAVYCLSVGVFEECVFRGLVFAALAGYFSNDKRGLVKTFVLSSVVFGAVHIFNIFGGNVGGTLLQVCYTTLTGGLFAFALIKTKNICCSAFVHALYNFCGLLLSEQGLGFGVTFDIATAIMMTVISVIIGVFVLVSLWKYTETERKVLYDRLGVKEKPKADENS